MNLATLATSLLQPVREAGSAIRAIDQTDVHVVRKQDGSPTTAADAAAEAILTKAIRALTPDIPVIAEEAMENQTAPHIPNGMFWLVDPLDGTKEFIGGTGDYTVNVALISQNEPVLGIVHVPARDELYWGYGKTAFRQAGSGEPVQLQLPPTVTRPCRVIMSRSHGDRRALTERFAHVPFGETVVAGSSLKFCRVAEGVADFYPRLGRTMEWDTAAGHAVLQAAGGVMLTLDGQPFLYQKPGFENPGFVALHPALVPDVFPGA